MTTVVFNLDLLDNNDAPLEVDLEALADYCLSNELEFLDEFKKRVLNWMVYSSSEGFSEHYDPQVYSIYLDVEPYVGSVDIDLTDGENWLNILALELEAIVDYGTFVSWDDDLRLRLASYLCYIQYDGWRWEEITFKEIKERMSTFKGVYSYKSEVVDELIEDGTLDPVPDWVVHDEGESADYAEERGYFSTYEMGWRYAVWI